ncbi:WxL protein host-binding domain-containing protein [Lacticaseibacillus absianus]|uniref:WxL protein host-binding domain-containing protein n=1 Tax=Lacticaseibacillus absianus TaxID=2729623 RepID=UPI0015CC08CD|nr:DUF3324 domain-containing protein [Lacticaseibacillus absianus]
MRHLVFLLLIALSLPATPVAGAESGAGFTLTSAVPDSAVTSYVRLTLPANADRHLQFRVSNLTDTAATYTAQVTDASTGPEGKITYVPGTPQPSETTRLSHFARLTAPTLSVGAHSTKTVTVRVQVPATGVPGDLLGALYVRRDRQADQAGEGLQNRFAMAVPIHLTGTTPPPARPRLSLKQAKLLSRPTGLAVSALLTNHSPRTFGAITLTTTVTTAAGHQVTRQQLTQAEMAPTSVMPLNLPLAARQLGPGRYTVAVTLRSGRQRYQLRDHFTIKATATAARPGARPTRLGPWMWLSLGLAGVVLLLLLLLWRQHRREATP